MAKGVVIVVDALAVAAASGLAHEIWLAPREDAAIPLPQQLVTLAIILPSWLAAFANAGLYQTRHVTNPMTELQRLIKGATVGTVVALAVATLLKFDVARLWVVLTLIVGVIVVGIERAVVRRVFAARRRHGHHHKPVVIVGTNDEALSLADEFIHDRTLGYDVRGLFATSPTTSAALQAPVIGGLDAPLDALDAAGATGVVIATTAVDQPTINRLTRQLTATGLHVELSSSLQDIAARRLCLRPVGRSALTYVEPTVLRGWRAAAKRTFDVTLASALLLVFAPVLVAAALAILIDSPGPIMFRQRRVGRGGAPISVHKLRTMVVDAEQQLDGLRSHNEAAWPLFKMRRDPRVTRVGRLLRKLSIDELPQLWNVVRGDMSLVGPRPALAHELAVWGPETQVRLRVRPGITGMWQVRGRSDASSQESLRLDLYYVENWTLWSDLAILARTVPAVLTTRGAY